MDTKILYEDAVQLLKKLVSLPSFSREEEATASAIMNFFTSRGVMAERYGNNVFARNKYFDAGKPTILLNSHHDTVKPSAAYTVDPFSPVEKEGKIFGLGSNDAGGCLVSLIAVFLHFNEQVGLDHNLVMAATAEEEISGSNGIESVLPLLGKIDFAIVGEPTQMKMAVAERGLLVVDCVATGPSGHVALNDGTHALYDAVDDINWIRNHRFDRQSPLLGETRMNVTVIESENKQHNAVPSVCRFVIDIRVNDCYGFEEILETLRNHLRSSVRARSTRLKPSMLALNHPLVRSGLELGMGYYGSLTTSDMALLPFPALKVGPGDSVRSHMADEFIFREEIEKGIETYIKLLQPLLQHHA
jgi:acetylornithine deacetylase